jgi:hypothetical protein
VKPLLNSDDEESTVRPRSLEPERSKLKGKSLPALVITGINNSVDTTPSSRSPSQYPDRPLGPKFWNGLGMKGTTPRSSDGLSLASTHSQSPMGSSFAAELGGAKNRPVPSRQPLFNHKDDLASGVIPAEGRRTSKRQSKVPYPVLALYTNLNPERAEFGGLCTAKENRKYPSCLVITDVNNSAAYFGPWPSLGKKQSTLVNRPSAEEPRPTVAANEADKEETVVGAGQEVSLEEGQDVEDEVQQLDEPAIEGDNRQAVEDDEEQPEEPVINGQDVEDDEEQPEELELQGHRTRSKVTAKELAMKRKAAGRDVAQKGVAQKKPRKAAAHELATGGSAQAQKKPLASKAARKAPIKGTKAKAAPKKNINRYKPGGRLSQPFITHSC